MSQCHLFFGACGLWLKPPHVQASCNCSHSGIVKLCRKGNSLQIIKWFTNVPCIEKNISIWDEFNKSLWFIHDTRTVIIPVKALYLFATYLLPPYWLYIYSNSISQDFKCSPSRVRMWTAGSALVRPTRNRGWRHSPCAPRILRHPPSEVLVLCLFAMVHAADLRCILQVAWNTNFRGNDSIGEPHLDSL